MYSRPRGESVSRAKFLPDLLHLFAGTSQRTGVVDHVVGGLDLFFVRKLGRDPPRDLRSRGFETKLLALRESLDALLQGAGHHDQTIKPFGSACFDEQGRFDNRHSSRILQADRVHPLLLTANHGWMNDPVEVRDSSRALVGAGEPKAASASLLRF